MLPVFLFPLWERAEARASDAVGQRIACCAQPVSKKRRCHCWRTAGCGHLPCCNAKEKFWCFRPLAQCWRALTAIYLIACRLCHGHPSHQPSLRGRGSKTGSAFSVQQKKGEGRKAAGVEPTKERLTPLTGFEARAHHRVHLPSLGWPAQGVRAAGHSTLGFTAISGWIETRSGSMPIPAPLAPIPAFPQRVKGQNRQLRQRENRFSAGRIPGRHRPLNRTQVAIGHRAAAGGCHAHGA